MFNSTWQRRIGTVLLSTVLYLVFFLALYPVMVLFASASQPPLWQIILGRIFFPWAVLLDPNYMSEVIICLLVNAFTWGVIIQLLIELPTYLKRS